MIGMLVRRTLAILGLATFLVAPLHAQVEPPPLEAYGQLPSVEDVIVSPSGNRTAFLATIGGRRMIIVLDADRKPLRSFVVGEIKVRQFEFINDDFLLMQRSGTEDLGYGFVQDQIEVVQAYVLGIETETTSLIFSDQKKLPDSVFGYHGIRMVDGKPVAYFGAIELTRSTFTDGYVFGHGRPALYAVDLLKNKARRADHPPSEGALRDWLVGGDGTIVARLDVSQSNGRWSIEGTRKTIASGQHDQGDVSLVAIGNGGATIVYSLGDDATGETRWYEVPHDGSAPAVEIFGDVAIERIFVDQRTGELLGYLHDDATLTPEFFDEANTEKVRKVGRAFKGMSHSIHDWTPTFDHVIVRTSGNLDSGTYLTVDLAALRAHAVGYERPLIEPDHVGPISIIDYTASDGLEMDGILTLPPGRDAKNLPLVMLPHGGPHNHDTKSFDWWAQAFASRGYAVFQPNFRGSTNRDEAFIRAGYGEWGGKMQSDISDGMKALADRGIIDPKRACIVGASYGGYAALAGVTLQQGLYRCAVSVNGVADVSLLSRIERRESGGSRTFARSLEEQLGPRSRYRDISPRFRADQADAPILLIHGRDDTVVAFEQSANMADALKDAGKPYRLIELEGEDHWLSLSDTRLTMLRAAVDFVELHNPPD